ncbi:MAG: AAA family ATPase [Oscillatoria sp. SIO1A7]|nr:AAA family ATPase [Oscillatoria sp. SIO1A7]
MTLELKLRPKTSHKSYYLAILASAFFLMLFLSYGIKVTKGEAQISLRAIRFTACLVTISSCCCWLFADRQEYLGSSDPNEEALAVAAAYQEKLKEVEQSLCTVRDSYENAIAELISDYETANAPRVPKGPGRMDWLGTQIILLIASKGMICDFNSYQETPGKDYYWVQPRNPSKWPEIKKIEEEIALSLGCSAISFSPCQELIQIEVSDPRIQGNSRKSLAKSTIEFAPIDLIACLENSNHFLITGDTGSGKSTFIANVCQAASEYYGGEASVFVIDPKFPDNDWGFEPQYKGFQRINNGDREYPDAYDGIAEVQRRTEQRFTEASLAKINNLPLPEKPLEIWVLDEAPAAVSVAA